MGKSKGKNRVFGHKNGVTAVRETVESAVENNIEFLTLYAFSTENWLRPKLEVNSLMNLLISSIINETKTLMNNDIKLMAIGDINKIPKTAKNKLDSVIEKQKIMLKCP